MNNNLNYSCWYSNNVYIYIMKEHYTYKNNKATAIINKCRGYWLLQISVPDTIVVLDNNIFPTKRAALKMAKHILNQY